MKKTVRKFIWLVVLFISLQQWVMGQPSRRERVEAERVAFITKRMQLTPKQAQGFWPIHTQYEKEERLIKQKYRTQIPIVSMTEVDAEEAIEKRLRMEEELLALKKNFYSRFKTVVSARQVLLFQKSNAEFKQYLLEEIRRRRNNRRGG